MLVYFLLSSTIVAAPQLTLEKNRQEYPLGPYLDILEDHSGQMTISDILALDQNSPRFRANTKKVPNFGHTNSAIWLRFTVFNPHLNLEHLLLEIDYPIIHSIKIYQPDGQGNYIVKKGGTSVPFPEREVKHRHFVFNIDVHGEELQIVYLRFQSEDTIHLPLTLWQFTAFFEKDHQEQYFLGLYYGMILVMVIYNLFLFFAVRDKAYLYYVLYITLFLFYQMSSDGLAFQYLWPNATKWGTWSLTLFILITDVFALLFARNFLNTKEHAPKSDKSILLLVLLGLLGICSLFVLDLSTVIQFGTIYTVIGALTLLIIGFWCWKKEAIVAQYFLLAWSSLLLGVIVFSLADLGLLPAFFLTRYAIQMGFAFEVILLSFGLAHRINFLRKESESSQKEKSVAQQYALEQEQKLKQVILENEERFRKLIDTTFEGVLVHKEGKILEVNEGFAAQVGFEHQKIPGMDVSVFIKSDSLELAIQQTESSQDASHRGVCVRKNGTTFHAEMIASKQSYRGELVWVVGIRDITEQVEFLETMQQKVEERTEKLFELQDQLLQVYQITQAVSSSLEIEEVNRIFIEKAVRAMRKESTGVVLFYDKEKNALVARASYGLDDQYTNQFQLILSPGSHYVYDVFMSQSSKIIDSEELATHQNADMLKLHFGKICTEQLIVPLLIGGKTKALVIISLYDSALHFTQSEQHLLENITWNFARHFEHALLHEKTEQKEKELAHINQVIRMVNATLNVDNVITTVVDVLREIFWFDQIGIQLVDEQRQELVFKQIEGRDITLEKVQQITSIHVSLEEKDSIFVETFFKKKRTFVPLITPELLPWLSSSDQAFFAMLPVKSYLCYPLIVRNQVIGTLSFTNLSDSFDLSEAQMDTIERYVFQIATSINNAELYEQTQEQQKQLQIAMDTLEDKDQVIQLELDIASQIQKNILPVDSFNTHGLKVVAYYESMGKVGGDIFNIIPMKNGKLGILIADAIGHGIPAAFITMMAQMTFNDLCQDLDSPKAILRKANEAMSKVLSNNEYLTAFFAIVSPNAEAGSHSVVYGNASHPSPIVVRKKNGVVENWDTRGLFLGFFGDDKLQLTYEENTDSLFPGDRVFFYTDGLTEARNTDKQLFKEHRVQEVLSDTKDLPLDRVKECILKSWREYTEDMVVQDDVTFILIEVNYG
ncbi:MAG: SpoIIE family protein phosphatase [SAR324 cluster bacterium]|nr:SpoIIE family protein phosphatase [SAR324 cluster bacterium]